MEPLISVVVPVYGVEAYLGRCVESLLRQRYSNIEILLVDDGSPDRCGEICDAYEKKDARIRVFHKANGGLSDARNYGTQRAAGQYITFVDSDDYVVPEYIAYLYELLCRYEADVSCCDLLWTREDSAQRPEEEEVCLAMTGREACRQLLGRYYRQLVVACGKLYKRELVCGNLFPVGRKHEDEAVTCRFLYGADAVVVSNQKLYMYYQRAGSIMQSKHEGKDEDAIWSLRARALFFETMQEKTLAMWSWDMLIRYLLTDSSSHEGRCDGELRETVEKCRRKACVSRKTQLWVMLYQVSPALYKKIRNWRTH